MYSGLYRNWWLSAALVALLFGVSLGCDIPPKIEYPRTPAEASRTYFQLVSEIIDQVARRIERSSPSSAPAMSVPRLRLEALAIDQVPTEYVDRDLVQWATQIRCQLDQAARECRQAAHQKVTASEGSELRTEADNHVRQVLGSMLKNVQQMQSEARSKMTQRYQVQF
jgi:hypothetical protein